MSHRILSIVVFFVFICLDSFGYQKVFDGGLLIAVIVGKVIHDQCGNLVELVAILFSVGFMPY